MNSTPPGSTNIIRLGILFEAAVLAFAFMLGWVMGRPLLPQLDSSWTALATGALATLPLLLFMWASSRSSLRLLQDLMRQVEEQLVPLFDGASTLGLLVVSILAGVGEELLFRGVLQPEAISLVGMPLGLILTSVAFGLAHLITPTYAVIAGMIGAYLGILTVYTDNLLVPVVAHTLYDFIALKYLINPERRATDLS